MTREIHMRILKPSPTRQGKFSKREGLFQKPLDIFQGKREENIEYCIVLKKVYSE